MNMIQTINQRKHFGGEFFTTEEWKCLKVEEWQKVLDLVAAVDSYRSNPDFENGRSMDMALTTLTKQEGPGNG